MLSVVPERNVLPSIFAAACVLLASSLSAAAQSIDARPMRSLSLRDAQRIALERSQLVRAQDASVVAAREMGIAAGQLPDPVVRIGIDNLPIEGADRFSIARDFMTMRRIGVAQEVTRAEKRSLRSERFEREAEKTLAEKSAVAASIERDTALAWLDRFYAEAALREIAEQVRLAKMEIEAGEGLFRAGRGSPADLIAARSTVAVLEDRARESAGRIRIAKNALARWVADEATELGPLPDITSLDVDTRTIDAHLGGHPDLQALARQEAIADVDARLAQANRRSDWTWEVMFQQRGSSYANMVSVGVSIPWQWDRANRQDREVAAKLAQIDEARARREEATRGHRSELVAMISEWETVRERRDRYRDDILRLAGERTIALTSAYRAGRTNSLNDVLVAQRNESDVRVQMLALDAQLAKLWAQIRFTLPHPAATPAATYPAATYPAATYPAATYPAATYPVSRSSTDAARTAVSQVKP